MAVTDQLNLVSIFSNWYSGATLFAILLNNHSNLVCNGETFPFGDQDPNSLTCSCGEKLSECKMYMRVASHMLNASGDDWNRDLFRILPKFSKYEFINRCLNSFRYMPGVRDFVVYDFPYYRRRLERFLEAHKQVIKNSLEVEKASIYVDGTKSIRRADFFSRLKAVTLRAMHLIRDGRAFCYSYLKNNKLPRKNLAKAAKVWLDYIQLVDMFSRRNPQIPIMVIRHEDLCRDKHKTARSICNFLGIPYEGFTTPKCSFGYHVLGHRMRKSFSGTINEDLTWKTWFSAKEIDIITEMMQEGLERFEYI